MTKTRFITFNLTAITPRGEDFLADFCVDVELTKNAKLNAGLLLCRVSQHIAKLLEENKGGELIKGGKLVDVNISS